MTQLELPLADAPESRQQRAARILAGHVEGGDGVARTFDEANAREAERLASRTDTKFHLCDSGSPQAEAGRQDPGR